MAGPRGSLILRVYEDYNTTALVDDLSGRWTNLRWSSAVHGGFKDLITTIPMPLEEAWLWLRREGAQGRHYMHVSLTDPLGTVWEGRVANIGLRADNGIIGIDLSALGYYSSLRDQEYSASDGGNTNWTAGGPHNTGKILRELITNECPSINGTADVELTTDNVVGIDLTARKYPMDIIIDDLAPVAGTGTAVYYFSVWEQRKPVWAARDGTSLHWLTSLGEVDRLELVQEGINLRNYVLPVIGTTEGTGTVDTQSTASYPRREITLHLTTGVPGTAANNARDAMIQERRWPTQSASFSIKGQVLSTTVGNLSQGVGTAMVDKPKWWVRAGEVIRIRDLVPHSVATGTLDNLRTFYILETQYDAGRDVLEIQPDRPGNFLNAILARQGTIERQR